MNLKLNRLKCNKNNREYTYTKKEGQVNKLSMEGATSINADVINGVSWYDIVSKLSNLLDE